MAFTYEVRGKSDNQLVKVFADELHLYNEDAATKAMHHLVGDGYFGGTFVCNVTEYGQKRGRFEFSLVGGLSGLHAVVEPQ